MVLLQIYYFNQNYVKLFDDSPGVEAVEEQVDDIYPGVCSMEVPGKQKKNFYDHAIIWLVTHYLIKIRSWFMGFPLLSSGLSPGRERQPPDHVLVVRSLKFDNRPIIIPYTLRLHNLRKSMI